MTILAGIAPGSSVTPCPECPPVIPCPPCPPAPSYRQLLIADVIASGGTVVESADASALNLAIPSGGAASYAPSDGSWATWRMQDPNGDLLSASTGPPALLPLWSEILHLAGTLPEGCWVGVGFANSADLTTAYNGGFVAIQKVGGALVVVAVKIGAGTATPNIDAGGTDTIAAVELRVVASSYPSVSTIAASGITEDGAGTGSPYDTASTFLNASIAGDLHAFVAAGRAAAVGTAVTADIEAWYRALDGALPWIP